jgi:hypothetical protein
MTVRWRSRARGMATVRREERGNDAGGHSWLRNPETARLKSCWVRWLLTVERRIRTVEASLPHEPMKFADRLGLGSALLRHSPERGPLSHEAVRRAVPPSLPQPHGTWRRTDQPVIETAETITTVPHRFSARYALHQQILAVRRMTSPTGNAGMGQGAGHRIERRGERPIFAPMAPEGGDQRICLQYGPCPMVYCHCFETTFDATTQAADRGRTRWDQRPSWTCSPSTANDRCQRGSAECCSASW